MIRLRVSTLEDFRRVVSTDFGDESALIERIRRGQWEEGPSNWQMKAGTAWHFVLQRPSGTQQFSQRADGTSGDWHEAFGHTFGGNDVAAALRITGPGLCEVTAGRLWSIGGQLVSVEGTADHVRGLGLTDHKAKFSTADARDYEPSLQWRFYLAIHGGVFFRYLLWSFKDPTPTGYCELRDVTPFRFWPYPGMESELEKWLGWFVEWAGDRGLLGELEVKRLLAAREN